MADRLLEIDDDGAWCWSGGFVVTVPRQLGKSTLARSLAGWFASQGLLVLGTSNRLRTSAEILRPLGRYVEERKGEGGRWRRALDQPELAWPGTDGRIVFQSSNDGLGVGWSPDVGIADEAWDLSTEAVQQGLVPALSAAANPLLLLTSTVGTSASALLAHYREAALAGGADVGLAEWSAPPGADWMDEETWRQASPEWTPRRLKFMRQQVKVLAESRFRSQLLNQTVTAEDSWIAPSVWSGATAPVGTLSGGVAAVEVTLDGSAHYVVHAVRDAAGVVEVAMASFPAFRAVDAYLQARRPQVVLAPKVYRNRLSRIDREVGAADVATAMPVLMGLLGDGRLRHNGDTRLAEQVLAAEAKTTQAGRQTLIARDGRSLSAMRALLWATAEASVASAGRPRLRVAR